MFTSPQNLRRMLAVSVAAVVTAGLAATSAAAHTELRGSDPEEGSQVDTLEQVRLEFSSALLDIGSELVLVDADGVSHELTPEFPEGEQAVVAPVDAQAVAAGEVVLDWRIVAEDGHPIEGEINFTYAPAQVEEPAAPEDDAAVSDEQEPAQEPEDQTPAVDATPITAEPISEELDEEAPAVWVWVLVGLAIAGLAMTAVALNRKRDTE